MGVIDRLRAAFSPVPVEERDYWPYVNFGGNTYPIPYLNQTLQGTREEIAPDFGGFATGAYGGNGVVFACLNARMALFKQATFMYRQLRSGTPGELFSTADLDILRTPWPNGTTGDLLARMIQDADLGGNAFVVRRPGRLARLRPDWTIIVHGSERDPDASMWDPDATLLGYLYTPGGPGSGLEPIAYTAAEVAHFAPVPDPLAPARGMSWLTPLVREIQADTQMTVHKQAYMTQGATPNLVVTGVPSGSPEAFKQWVAAFSKGHDGPRNAGKTMYLSGTVDAKVIGSDLRNVDFKAVQGAGETRIAAAAGVPPIVVGLSEGLAGSSLNAGNFAAAMRRFADLTGRSLWQDAAGALATIVARKPAAELWYDDRGVPALKDDIKDAAEVQALQAQAIRQYVDAGFDPMTVVEAIRAGDLKRLRHSGLYSVQLQPPMPEGPPDEPSPDEPAEPDADDAEEPANA